MNNRQAFYQAILENPDDLPLRLVFAGWLEEQGDPQAELIRLQCELEALPNRYDERGLALQQRERDLLEKHAHAWLGPVAELDRASNSMFRTIFRRGWWRRFTRRHNCSWTMRPTWSSGVQSCRRLLSLLSGTGARNWPRSPF
jgi:uncharacterized protein (TIGR02996 family)